MAACGLKTRSDDDTANMDVHEIVVRMTEFAIEMNKKLHYINEESFQGFKLRIGKELRMLILQNN